MLTNTVEMPVVSAILVNYNTRQMTLNALKALGDAMKDVPSEVWVVDNASDDGSADAIRINFPHVNLVLNEQNEGFGAANNRAMDKAKGKFLLLLNSDAFVEANSVTALLECMQRHPSAGVVGPRLLNRDGSLQKSCFPFPTPKQAWMENLWVSFLWRNDPNRSGYRYWRHDQEREVDWVTGACMLVRKQSHLNAGGFDERFFLYSEETDWQYRIRASGWRIIFTPMARVTHFGGASGTNDGRTSGYFFESLDRYELKHHGWRGLVSLRLAMAVGCAVRAFAWTAVAAIPRRRRSALAKAKAHVRLFFRQMTMWSIPKLRVSASVPYFSGHKAV